MTKALCVRQPEADLIVFGRKTIEVRTWRTAYRGALLITASKRKPLDPQFADSPLGCLVGAVDLVDCRPFTESDQDAALCDFEPGLYAWALANPRVTPQPIPTRSLPGLFDLAPSRGYELVSAHLYIASRLPGS